MEAQRGACSPAWPPGPLEVRNGARPHPALSLAWLGHGPRGWQSCCSPAQGRRVVSGLGLTVHRAVLLLETPGDVLKRHSHIFLPRRPLHKQSWMVGIRPPGSHWFHPVFVISPEAAGARGGVCNGHGWNAERPGRLGSPLFIWSGHVMLPRPFCNWSPCSSFYFA